MTLVTINAVVDIPSDVVMVEIVGVVSAMTTGALEYGIVVRVGMAGRAHVVRIPMAGRKRRVLGVVEVGAGPGRRVVAVLACRGEELLLRGVSRVRRIVVIGLVAANAGDWQSCVIAVDVAIGASPWRHCVRACQRERRRVVVKGGVRPNSCVVAQLARGREASRRMRRIRRARIILLMARVAQRAVQCVVVVDVAVGAQPRRHRVRARQLKTGTGVVKRSIGPEHGVMACLTCRREACCNVVHWCRRVVVVGLMARHARRARQVVVIVDVTIRTLPRRHSVRTCQYKPRTVVVEGSVQPGRRAVALIASLGEVSRDVIRIRCALVVLQVAGDASRAIQRVVVVNVAIGTLARRNGVEASQRKAGGGMIELAIGPQHRVMALLARRRKAGVRHRRGRIVVVGLMARHARRRGDVVVVVNVAIRTLARRNRVRAGQRESRLRVIKSCRLPSRSIVASVASLREASGHVIRVRRVVEILQVARDASGAGQVVVIVDMAVRALPRRHRVRAGQSEVHHRVIESRRGPGHRGMALLAGRGEVCRDVIGVRRALKILQVAANAACAGQVVVVVDVAIGTLPRRHCMPASQRESCRRVIELRVQPIVGGVTVLACGGELRVDVIGIGRPCKIGRVTGIALRGHRLVFAIGHTLMTGVAVDCRVRSGQREAVVMLLDLLD